MPTKALKKKSLMVAGGLAARETVKSGGKTYGNCAMPHVPKKATVTMTINMRAILYRRNDKATAVATPMSIVITTAHHP